MKKAVTLLSGGLDSSAATLLAMKECEVSLALTFNYGQRAVAQEISAASKMCEMWGVEHEIINIDWLAKITRTALVDDSKMLPTMNSSSVDENASDHADDVWVPNRNALFISIAASFAEAKGYNLVIAGFNREEAATFPDNTQEFMDATNSALAYSTKSDVQIISPTIGMTKMEIAARLIDDKELTKTFWCCYESGEKLCGKCESCARTVRAFEALGRMDLIRDRL
jgi:7-cyano-7-deazaguanine synthase